MSPDLAKLIALQEIDLRIQQMKIRLATIPAERERIEARFNEYSSEYNQLREQLDSARAEHKRLETELAETQKHHEKYKEDLMKVRNEKEYTTCLREIDSTKKAAAQLETETLQAMEEVEKLEAELAEFTPAIENRRRTVDEELATCDQDLASGQAQIDEVMLERNELIKDMPKALMANYDRLSRSRNGIALSEVVDRSCSACRMKVRPQAYSEVKRGDQIMICESCSRILFYRAEQPEASAATE